MINKEDLVKDWLPRYTGTPIDEFGKYILLTNFYHYVKYFSQKFNAEIKGKSNPMQTCTANDITILNFGMGSAMAATVMDLLTAIQPEAVLFLGKCGGLKKKTKLGDFILPIAAIRGEGTSNDYYPPEIPAMPSFALQRSISSTIMAHKLDYWTGTIYTTNRRVWEHDINFKEYLKSSRAIGIDMETATVFIVGFHNEIPRGALLLVSDNPLDPEGVKTAASDVKVTENFVNLHIDLGVEALEELRDSGESVKHLKFQDISD
ncbi:MAG: AMP nucleosidase [Bdellovibrionales bacterium]|nr:AMP nucleosidase [Bdellovibrionales bacterium]